MLQYGAVEEHNAKDGWIPIIHRDLKDGNVFLDRREEGDTEFPVSAHLAALTRDRSIELGS